MEAFIYDGKPENLQKALDAHRNGVPVVCAICGSDLIIIGRGDSELITKYQLSPGIYCLSSPRHIHQAFLFSEPFEEFKRRFGGN